MSCSTSSSIKDHVGRFGSEHLGLHQTSTNQHRPAWIRIEIDASVNSAGYFFSLYYDFILYPDQFPINVVMPKTSTWTVPRTAFPLSIPSTCSRKLPWPHSLCTRRSAFHMSDTAMRSGRGKQDECSACFLSSFLPPEHSHTPFISIPWHIAIRSVHQEQNMAVKTEIVLECRNNHCLIESWEPVSRRLLHVCQ